MADNANTTVGILSLMAKFDEGSVTEAARIACNQPIYNRPRLPNKDITASVAVHKPYVCGG